VLLINRRRPVGGGVHGRHNRSSSGYPRARAGGTVDLEVLARLLFYSAGVTRVAAGGRGGGKIWFRAAASAGNLHPLEAYVVTRDINGLGAGLYHFAPDVFGLESLSPRECHPYLADAVAEA
jgi:hypothetical protein